jgi:hypothetical protein
MDLCERCESLFSGRGKAVGESSNIQQANEMLAMGKFDASAKYRVLSFVLAGSRWSYFSTVIR